MDGDAGDRRSDAHRDQSKLMPYRYHRPHSPLRRRGAGGHRRAGRNAVLRLLGRRYRAALPGLRQRVRGRSARDLLRRQGELESGHSAPAGPRAGGLRHRLRRRALSGAAGRRRSAARGVLRRRQDGRRDRVRACAKASTASTASRTPSSSSSMRWPSATGSKARVAIRVNPDVDACDASLHLDRPARAQVRHRHRGSGRRLRTRRAACPTCRSKA